MSDEILSKKLPGSKLARAVSITNLGMKISSRMAVDAISGLTSREKLDFGSLLLSKNNFESIADTLASMRGAAMKFGQILSIDNADFLPADLSDILSRLRSQGYSMPPNQLKRTLNQSWGTGWLKQFRHFEVRPFAAASIGQVHKAVDKKGQELAIKVQFPNIQQSIRSDLRILQIIARTSGLFPKELDLDHYLKICEAQLFLETDYIREADFLCRFNRLSCSTNGIKTPKFFENLSTETILTMSLEKGVGLDRLNHFSENQKARIAMLMVHWTISEVFDFQLIQTDPNFANYRYDVKSGNLKLLDFGACIELSPEVVRIYSELVKSILGNEITILIEILNKCNLIPAEMTGTTRQLLEKVLNIALHELHASDTFSFSNSKVFDYINAENMKEMSAMIPTSLIPADLLLMQRKLIGLIFLLRRLGASLPLKEMLRKQMNSAKTKPAHVSNHPTTRPLSA